MSAKNLSAFFPNFATGTTCVFANPMCLLVFQSLSGARQSTQAHVSTNGYLKGWQCSLLISNVVPGISGTIINLTPACSAHSMEPARRAHNGAHEFAEFDVQLAKVLFVDFAMATCKTSNWCNQHGAFADDFLLFGRTKFVAIFMVETLMEELAHVGLCLNTGKTIVLTNAAQPPQPQILRIRRQFS